MDISTEDGGGEQFADGQNNRDLRVGLDARDQDTAQDTQQDPPLDTNPLPARKNQFEQTK